MIKHTHRSLRLIGVGFVLAVASPTLAQAATTSSSVRAEQTVARFYRSADRFTVRQGFSRIVSQRTTLNPFFKTFESQATTGSQGDASRTNLDASISEGVVNYAQRPLIELQEAAAKQLDRVTSGTAHRNAELLTTYFADEAQAAQTLPQFSRWESDRFFNYMPEAIQTLNVFVRDHGAFLAKDVNGGDPFRSAEPTMSSGQRALFAGEGRALSRSADALALVIYQMARGWEGISPGTGGDTWHVTV